MNKKTDLTFVYEIINGHQKGYDDDCAEGLITVEQCEYAIVALENLKNTLKHFIKETNQLTKDYK